MQVVEAPAIIVLMEKKPKIPTPEVLQGEVVELYEMLSKEQTEMAVVLLSVAYLDRCLASLLHKFFIDANTSTKLLSHKGAIGTFHTRSELAYCLGLIPKGLFKNLITLGEIRNLFGHSHLALTFTNAEISNLCSTLTLPKMTASTAGKTSKAFESLSTSSRSMYVLVVCLVAQQLTNIASHTEKREPKQGWQATHVVLGKATSVKE